MRSSFWLVFLTLCGAVPALGHSVWIEPASDGQLIIRFAEPDGKLERSPGHLDELSLPVAWMLSTNGPIRLETQKKSDHFLIVGSSVTNAVEMETCFEVMARPGTPGRLPYFYARWNPSNAPQSAPALVLDLVPSKADGEARVYFRGKPLGGVKATLRTPDEKEQSLTSEDDGTLRFKPVMKGLHMLSIAHHRETLPGFAGGRAYELTSHNASLTWIQP